MTRWPTRAIFSLTPAPIAATTPHGSWPPMTGFGLTGKPPIDSPPDLGRRYWCRSLPHMPEAFISTTTSSGPGLGSGNSISSISRSPVKTTPRIGFLRFSSRFGGTSLRRFGGRRDYPSLARHDLALLGHNLRRPLCETDSVCVVNEPDGASRSFRAYRVKIPNPRNLAFRCRIVAGNPRTRRTQRHPGLTHRPTANQAVFILEN